MSATASIRSEAVRLAAGRLLLGLVSFAFAGRVAAAFGFPAGEYDTGTARALGRLYAIREAALGYHLIAEARGDRGPQPLTVGVNMAVDAADATMFAAAAVRGDGIDRAAVSIAGFAAVITILWLRLLRRVMRAHRS